MDQNTSVFTEPNQHLSLTLTKAGLTIRSLVVRVKDISEYVLLFNDKTNYVFTWESQWFEQETGCESSSNYTERN